MDARGRLLRASITLALVLIPPALDLTANAANFVKTDSAQDTTMWVDRKIKNFPLQTNWKLVRVVVQLHNGTESLQTYVVDFAHNRSALVEANGSPVPVGEWRWMPGVPDITTINNKA